MSAHNIRHKLLHAGFADEQKLVDPGSGGTVRVDKDKGVLVLTSAGARTFISAARVPLGTEVLICATVSGATINGTSVGDGEFVAYHVTLDSSGDNEWTLQSADTALQADIDALEALAYRTYVDELNPADFRVHDALQTTLPTAGANDDLGITYGAIGSSRPTLNATVDDETLTQEGVVSYRIPEVYRAGDNLTLSVDFTRTAAAVTSATLDAEVYEFGAPSTDICGAASPSGDINSAASGAITFTITGTNLTPGDLLYIRLIAAINDGTGTTAAAVFEFSASVSFTVADES